MSFKKASVVSALILVSTLAFAQQITRIAVVDLAKVIAACSKDAESVKAFEDKKAQVQADIDAMSAQITQLSAQKADADKAGDKVTSQRIKADIDAHKKTLMEFISAKQAELDADAKKLGTTDAFSKDLYKKIQDVAQTDGYSLVLNLRSADDIMNAVLWYSPAIDITPEVIQALTGSTTGN